MAKFSLNATDFSAEYSLTFQQPANKFVNLKTNNSKFVGVGYETDGQLFFYFNGVQISIWADDVTEAVLGASTLIKDTDYNTAQELYNLTEAYAASLA